MKFSTVDKIFITSPLESFPDSTTVDSSPSNASSTTTMAALKSSETDGGGAGRARVTPDATSELPADSTLPQVTGTEFKGTEASITSWLTPPGASTLRQGGPPPDASPNGVALLPTEQHFYSQRNAPHFPGSPPILQPFASGGQYYGNNAAYFSWPTSTQLSDAAEVRANYFRGLEKAFVPKNVDQLSADQQATTLLDLMTIRAFHSKVLHCCSLGTAIGFRIRKGMLTDIPAILVFVARKIHKKWLNRGQCLPSFLEGPGGVWCDVDVVEFSYYGVPALPPKEQHYTEFADGLRGSDACTGSGSQVASLETYGTLGVIVKRRTGGGQVGFLTNRHVAVDLDYPTQKMFHPLPPNLGPGVYLGAVTSSTSLIMDDLWYGIFAGRNPETFVRADGAFIPFADDFDISSVSILVKGMGEIGKIKCIDLHSPITSLVGRRVTKVGRSSGLTTGTVIAYALEYNDEKGICFCTDFLVMGENQQTFDLEGDSGSLVTLTGEGDEKPRPIGIIWGGRANRGTLKVGRGHAPENWTSGVDLGRLLNSLELDLITTEEDLQVAVQEQRKALAPAVDSMDEVSPQSARTTPKDEPNDIFEPLDPNIQHDSIDHGSGIDMNVPFLCPEFDVDRIGVATNVEEHQFIPFSPLHREQEENLEPKSLAALKNASDDDLCVSLHLGD